MTDIKLFRLQPSSVDELQPTAVRLERALQSLIERHLETVLGLRLLASDYPTGHSHPGRIDTLGLDDHGSPVIVEYKRARDENVLSQGLFYLDWLLDHRAEVRLLALKRVGRATAARLERAAPRLVCVAAEFSRYDLSAIRQIDRAIELIRYRTYGEELPLLERLGASRTPPGRTQPRTSHLTARKRRKGARRGTR